MEISTQGGGGGFEVADCESFLKFSKYKMAGTQI